MKKVFAILLVLALVVGFVFASDTHELRVKANVTEVPPAFNLYHVEGTDTNSSTANYYGVNNADNSYTSLKDNTKATDVGFTLDKSGSFVVTAEVINDVKSTVSYKLTFSGGVFSVSRNSTSGLYYSPSKITVANALANDTNNAVASMATTPTSSSDNTENDQNITLSGYTTVKFSGKTGSGATTPITLATATFSYPGDTSIDPTTDTGVPYYADITMTVTVNN